jgi:hypothetical protein
MTDRYGFAVNLPSLSDRRQPKELFEKASASKSRKANDHAELDHMASKCIDQLSSASDQQVASTKDQRRFLRVFAFHGHEWLRRSPRCLADRLGIRRIILLALYERPHVSRRNQLHLVSQPPMSRPQMTSAAASLHSDDDHTTSARLVSIPARSNETSASLGTRRSNGVEIGCRYGVEFECRLTLLRRFRTATLSDRQVSAINRQHHACNI